MKPNIGFIAAILCAAFVGGCTGTRQIAHDREFVQLYTAQQTARDRQDFVGSDAAAAAMMKLAVEARAGALEARRASRVLDAIALYRVATSAAWKSGRGGAVEIAREGLEACDSLPNKRLEAPRDCMFLELSQPLSAIDQRAAQIDSFARRASTIRDLPEAQRRAAVDEAKAHAADIARFANQADDIVLGMDTAPWVDVLAPEMRDYAARQVHIAFCHGWRAALVLDDGRFFGAAEATKSLLASGKLQANVAKRAKVAANGPAICRDFSSPR